MTLGNKEDKNVTWGATVPDKKGNFYYTSFSSLGFLAPYLFFKILNLSTSIFSLYIFNSFLLLISALVTGLVISQQLKKYNLISKENIFLIASILYLFQIELMHSQGIVYWHHSLFQMLYILQILFYLQIKHPIEQVSLDLKKIFFYILILILPYLEWTGYISNFGFFLLVFFEKIPSKQKIKKMLIISILTILSGLVFYYHYLLNIDSTILNRALISRFMARNFTRVNISYFHLLKGYLDSYKNLIFFTITTLVITLSNKKSRCVCINIFKEQKYLIFLLIFPLLENMIMKEHAISYSFDRMKLAFPLIFLSVLTLACLKIIIANLKLYKILCFLSVLIICIINLNDYKSLENYRWKVDYLEKNKKFAEYVNTNFPSNQRIIGQNLSVRGYSNLLFESGVYEHSNLETILNITASKNIQYAIFLEAISKPWNVYEYTEATIFDFENKKTIIINNNLEIKEITK